MPSDGSFKSEKEVSFVIGGHKFSVTYEETEETTRLSLMKGKNSRWDEVSKIYLTESSEEIRLRDTKGKAAKFNPGSIQYWDNLQFNTNTASAVAQAEKFLEEIKRDLTVHHNLII